MRLKKQKEEQQDLQKRAMASIAAAASSAGISLPTTSAPTTAVSTMKTNGASPSDATAGVYNVSIIHLDWDMPPDNPQLT